MWLDIPRKRQVYKDRWSCTNHACWRLPQQPKFLAEGPQIPRNKLFFLHLALLREFPSPPPSLITTRRDRNLMIPNRNSAL
jgi:hypothetical protein